MLSVQFISICNHIFSTFNFLSFPHLPSPHPDGHVKPVHAACTPSSQAISNIIRTYSTCYNIFSPLAWWHGRCFFQGNKSCLSQPRTLHRVSCSGSHPWFGLFRKLFFVKSSWKNGMVRISWNWSSPSKEPSQLPKNFLDFRRTFSTSRLPKNLLGFRRTFSTSEQPS